MTATLRLLLALLLAAAALPLRAASPAPSDDKSKDAAANPAKAEEFKPEEWNSKGAVTIGGKRIEYDAHAGTLIVHSKGWDDVAFNHNPEDKTPPAQASMYYVAYFKANESGATRPITFLFNGGPGSATVWLHMGAFGPRRVVTSDNTHTPAAPYQLINNEYSLLDASDLVFIDAPGAGFSRVGGKDHDKAFYSVDGDAYAFAEFITAFMSKYGRWNSPKYLFGESYGTTRAANLVNMLENGRFIDFNGVIMLSQILCFSAEADDPENNPGVDLPYELVLPTYAATAWYHHRLPDAPAELPALLTEVEHFALTDYAVALGAGSMLPTEQRHSIALKLHQYTGLPVDYLEKSDLRVNVGQFQKTLEGDVQTSTGRVDTRFTAPTLDPLSKEADADPFLGAIASAYTSLYNDYARKELKVTTDRQFRVFADVEGRWDMEHQPPGAGHPLKQSTNVMLDLANAMKQNPNLKVMLNAGYYDLATPFFEGVYEMHHLPIPAKLQDNIEYAFYDSGHMVYAHEPSLRALHDRTAAFIARTALPGGH